MTNPILSTKLYIPRVKSNLVTRSRLIEKLEAGRNQDRQLTLISAPAGFGKTTLASEWIAECHLQPSVAWISLDEGDNDPNRFLYYLIAALQQVDPKIGENLKLVLQSSQPFQLSELVVQLINQIEAAGKPVLLVLDDYHLITSEAIHQVAQLVIERQPSRMHTVILTREDPPFPLPRMQVRGQITGIRERDLRFTLPEAQAFLVEAMGLELSSEEVEQLKERTEGWVAGMQLAALALEDYTDDEGRRRFIEAFAGSDRFIVDYLISEVLQRQSETARQFLLDSSILERFCAELCDQVVYGEASAGRSQSILDDLEQGNMFLVPLDNQRRWYRYHHLFAEMLSHTLKRTSPDRVPQLHRKACEWFETKGLTREAVRHALASEDWNFTGAVLDRHAMRLLIQGWGNLVIGWCQALPEDFIKRMPAICIYFAWGLVLTFRNDYLDAVEEKLHLAERAIEAPGIPAQAGVGPMGSLVPLRDWVTGQICVIRSQLLLARFNKPVDPQELISLSLKGLELLPEAEKPIRSTCMINLALAHLIQNNPSEAEKALEVTLPFMLEANNLLGVVTVVIYQVRLKYYLGHIDQALSLCQQWKAKFAAMSDHPERDIPATRGLDIILGMLLLERNQFDTAEKLLTQALEVLGWASWEELHGFITLAQLYHLRGDHTRVEEVLHRMAKMGPQHASCAEAMQVLFDIRTSPEDPQRRSKADAWVKAQQPNLSEPIVLGIGPYHCDVEYFRNLTWAQVQIVLGRPKEALAFIDLALSKARENHLTYRAVELGIAQALAQDGLGEHAAAVEGLKAALEIAMPIGYVRVFDQGLPLSRMLIEIAEESPHPESVQQLLAAFYQPPARVAAPGWPNLASAHRTAPQVRAAQPALIEPLSDRELEVLRLIAEGYSNSQIAERLYITQGTVKRHINNLYGKLLVQTRTQAVARAREIGLIG